MTFAQPSCADTTGQKPLVVGGLTRWYRVHLPVGYDSTKRYPAVIVLHGAAANYTLMEKVSGMSDLADAEQFVVIYPNGTAKVTESFASWNGGDCCGYAFKKKVDDIGFLDKLISEIEREYAIDPTKMYIAGFSNGGMLAYAAAARLQDKVAAMGIVEGSMSGKEQRPTKPMPVVIFHGTEDKHVPYQGGKGKYAKFGNPVNDKPVHFAVQFWCNVNHCKPTPVETVQQDVIKDEYKTADGKPAVILYTIVGGGHAWAGGERSRPWGAKPPKSIDATKEMWKFFSQSRR
jgi:polyhydroxybutyrate depolymerase